MAYKCNNKDCSNYNIPVNPGGTIIIKGNKPFYTGSICKQCNSEMEHIANSLGGFKTIINNSDGRNW